MHATTISEPVISNFGRGTRPILPKDIECTVDDDTLSGCATTHLDISQCQHEAGLICAGVYIRESVDSLCRDETDAPMA